MKPLILTCLLCLSLLIQEKPASVEFKPGQSVYVVAIKSDGTSDFTSERKAKDEFEKQKVFRVAASLSQADFVYFIIAEYEYNQATVGWIGTGSEDLKNAAALVTKPADYSAHKANLDDLRNAALWQLTAKNGMWRGGGVPSKLVKAFHEQALKKK